MKKTFILSAATAVTLAAGSAFAAGTGGHVTDYAFSFEGPFGSYDQDQLQRGLQVYTEICSGCHGLQYVPFRALEDLGYTDAEVRAYAENFFVPDTGPEALPGDERPAIPTDYFPGSALSNAPDLSLMAKARAGFHGPAGTGISQLVNGMGGAEYIASVLAGYTGEEQEQAGVILYENEAYGGYFAMSQPLWGDDVVYADGTEATLEQQAQDVAAFLMWAAEPKLEARKTAGITAVLFLGLLTVLLYLSNKKLWAPVKHRKENAPAE
ncbi:cytochrome c1 [Halovulum dunhuangense]|uniref:Cytochrome c1 n=1 Tax=Halovulum dunhuangense TaxID=1505036 RepID=A0A849KXJ1_9RHOB|nr:cytochrome c1 [Halovulum dunhuangense]NNU79297.1 cytochrome c1 [Halovulum dunhuangense]